MAKDEVTGTDWSPAELDRIVADYFAMLGDEQAGRHVNKTAHRNELMKQIQRSKGSIEFKHQNISAVLVQLGLPRINGYLPAWNFQGAIADAIGRYLRLNPEPVPLAPALPGGLSDPPELVEHAPPVPPPLSINAKKAFERVARKFDPALRDQRNRELGRAGEERIFEFECQKLLKAERSDLARRVRWISQEEGDGLGFDILSFDLSGKERLIEVKTTRGGGTTPFYLTANEDAVARERPDAFRLYRVYEFSRQPRLFTLAPPLEAVLRLETLTYRASLR
jgi:hypothetical protein